MQRLERLAAPKQPATSSPQAGLQRDKCTFSPRIGAVWRDQRDWRTAVCHHEAAGLSEIDSWFPQLANLTGKKKDRARTNALKVLKACEHSELSTSCDGICKQCRYRFCEDCLGQLCAIRKQRFVSKSTEDKLEELQRILLLSAWEAKALLRTSTPVSERLFNQAPRGKKRVPERGLSDPGPYWSLRAIEATKPTKAFLRLTSPREEKAIQDMPYLPNMGSRLPDLADLVDDAGAEPLEDAVKRLQLERKITSWQAKALIRCAAPVFDRLYPKNGLRERYGSAPA